MPDPMLPRLGACRCFPPGRAISSLCRCSRCITGASSAPSSRWHTPGRHRRRARCGRLGASARTRVARNRRRRPRVGIRAVAWTDDGLSAALAAIVDPPPVLWVRGRRAALAASAAVAIVGSRAGSPYALAVAERLAADLAARGLRGRQRPGARRRFGGAPRRARQRAADRSPCSARGADVIYPASTRLAREVAERGALVSELVPGTPPLKPHFFPRRNRIISGLARASWSSRPARRADR